MPMRENMVPYLSPHGFRKLAYFEWAMPPTRT